MSDPLTPASPFSERAVEWRIPIGCDFSGFFVEVALGYIPILRPHVSELFLLQTRCPDAFLRLLPEGEAAAYLSSQVADNERTPAQTVASIAIEHGNPCQMRAFCPAGSAGPGCLPRPYHVVARVMSEGLLPQDQLRCAAAADELWVPTSWHARVFESQGLPPLRMKVLPEFVDTGLFRPADNDAGAGAACELGEPERHDGAGNGARTSTHVSVGHSAGVHLDRARGGFTFVSVFKWEHRKGWDVLLGAYWSAFRRQDGTTLRLRTYKPSWEPGPERIEDWLTGFAAKRFGKTLRRLPRVEVLPELSRAEVRLVDALAVRRRRRAESRSTGHLQPRVRHGMSPALSACRAQLAALYASSDAFVLPSRGEGWCLPCMEAMSAGLPVLVTNHSGPASFLTDNNSYPIAVANVDVARRATPDESHLVSLMRRLVAEPGAARRVGERARADIIARFSAPSVAERALELLHDIVRRKTGGETATWTATG